MLDSWIAFGNEWGTRWFAWIVAATVDSALLFAMIGLVWLAVRRRSSPQFGYWLFALIPIKLLLPLTISIPAPLAAWTPASLVSGWTVADQTVESPSPPPNPAPLPVASVRADLALPVALSSPRIASGLIGSHDHQPTATNLNVTPHVAPSLRLSIQATLMLAWLVCVCGLLAKFLAAQLRFRRQVARMRPLDASETSFDQAELRRLSGLTRPIRFVEGEGIAAPSVWGIFRPVVIVPREMTTTLTKQQARWVLLHELAHIGRSDLAIVIVQRLAAMLHFFNPVVWVANRLIHQLREYACDDLATARGQASSVESGEAFVRVLLHAQRKPQAIDGALGLLGLDSRACCLRRAHRLLDDSRPIRTTMSALSVACLIALAAVTVPHLQASPDPTTPAAQDPAKSPEPPRAALNEDDKPRPFELRIVGPDGKPVPEAAVEIRSDKLPSKDQVKRGGFQPGKERASRVYLLADREGVLAVELPGHPSSLDVFIIMPGYGPYWAGWSSQSYRQEVPAQLTIELEAAWSVGGIIVDDAGKPVEGAKIHPSIEFRKRPGDTSQLSLGNMMKSDAQGKWRFDSVPASMADVYVSIDKPEFKGVQKPLARNGFGIESGGEPTATISLDRGLTVSGKVTDEAGRPIENALVRTKFLNDLREARTGADGVYHLHGCETLSTRVVVSAKGRATDMKEVTLDPGMGPLDFTMKPGGHVKIRVVAPQGKPVPKARILFQNWRGGSFGYFEFDHISQYADENGVWVWDEAPLDEFKADICPHDGLQQLVKQPIIARPEEYVFRVPDALVISGKVIDAETKEPIKAFRVVPGWRDSSGKPRWNRRGNFDAGNGHYELSNDRVEESMILRIEAPGYRAETSRPIKPDEGKIQIDFELTHAQKIAAKVVTPQNLPAAGARIALAGAGDQVNLLNGEIDDGSTYSDRSAADNQGRFEFAARDSDFHLVITHPTGYAHLQSTPDWDRTKIIRLQPWAKVEGTLTVGRSLAPNVKISMGTEGSPHSYGPDAPSIFTTNEITTGQDGGFTFDRVFPGRGWVGRNILFMVDDGAREVTSIRREKFTAETGKTTRIDVGGTGRPVIGKLKGPDGAEEPPHWSFAQVDLDPPNPKPDSNEMSFMATVDRDGNFRIDDVPPGTYQLTVRYDGFRYHGKGRAFLQMPKVQVPPFEGKLSSDPVDLGTLTLQAR